MILALLAALQGLPQGDSLLAAGDTNGAIAVYERLTQRNWRNAEAQWRAGRLYWSRHEPGSQLSPNRRKAEEHFRYATRAEPDSAKYWLALAVVLRSEDWMPTRMQVEGLFADARAAAERTADTARLAEASYLLGRAEFERWEHYRSRVPPGTVWPPPLNAFTRPGNWRDQQWQLEASFAQARESGEDPARAAEDHLRRAVALAPGQLVAAGLLVMLLGERNDWSQALDVARQVWRAAPDSAMAWALLGLTYARLERWHEAEAVFDSAFARMTPGERAPYDNIGLLLRQAERLRFDQMSPAEQGAARADYWSLTQPLMLTGENEPRTEYYARVTQARLRWSDEWLGHDGAQTARGLVYLRYGPPDMVGIVSRSFITWIYWPARFMMHFILPSGFTNARFAEPSRQEFQQRVLGERGGFDNITLVRELDTIAAQVVQFRGEDDRTALTVFTWVPLARMVGTAHLGSLDLQSAIFVFPDGREGQRIARTETLDPSSAAAGEHRTWRFDLVPGAHLLRIEALARALDRGARHSTLVDVRSYAGAAFTLSDILVARRLAPRDSTPERWMDFFIEPSAAHLTRDDPVSFLWEMYNLRPGPDGLVRWRVELRVQVGAIERREWNSWFLRIFGPALGALGDAVGASALGDEPVALAWEGSRDAHAGGTVVDWITLDFAEAPPGRYDVTLVITDLLSGTAVERTRTLIRSSFTPGQ